MSNTPGRASLSEQITLRLSHAQPYPSMQPPYRTSLQEGPANPLVSLPPLRQLSNAPHTSSDRRNGNPFGAHIMLNPQAELNDQQRGRRHSASRMESPSPAHMQHSQSLPSISRPTSIGSVQDDYKPPCLFPSLGRPPTKHILNSKSPKSHRTQSLSLLHPPTGTIDAHPSPFLSANTRPSDSVTEHAALSTPPADRRSTYFTVGPPMAPTPPPNMMRTDIRRPTINFPQSGSEIPIVQYSPYSQSAQGHYGPGPGPTCPHETRDGTIHMETERNNMIPMASSSQSSIQLISIKQHGHPVQIPVDVQAASKVADEKRRRNAGASARFRARRREKEREASVNISRLEQQVRDALEDAEYYRNERDYFKAIIFQQPSPKRHYARPPSPRLRRLLVAPSHAPSSTTGAESDRSFPDYDDKPQEE